ncbi:MAG: 4-hydroxy-3-methylbut-2-enyl diphosphate reductase [Pseudomonadota bacterium]
MAAETDTPDATRMKKTKRILLAAPRGFCAGVDRAIQIVELALKKYGSPVYVRHEIVHNRHVVEDLRRKGAIFIDELHEIPDESDAPVIFSAHGVPKSVPADAHARNMFYLDATCPLVSKVHIEASRLHEAGREILLIGHAGHPEVIGTLGQLPPGTAALIQTVEDAAAFEPRTAPENLAFITQTTLSVDDTAEIVGTLQRRFPDIRAPVKEDICYATTNRQAAVKQMAASCDTVIIVGAPSSSNSNRLVEVAQRNGCENAILAESVRQIPWHLIEDASSIGLSAGASAPEMLVQEIIDTIGKKYETEIETITAAEENITFKLPRELRDAAA